MSVLECFLWYPGQSVFYEMTVKLIDCRKELRTGIKLSIKQPLYFNSILFLTFTLQILTVC